VHELISDDGFRRAVRLVASMRLILGVAVIVMQAWHPVTFVSGDHVEMLTPRSDDLWTLVSPWERWDARWYVHLARDGFSAGTPDGGFLPLYPLLMRAGAWVLGGEESLAGLVISTLCLIGALTLLHRLLARDLGVEVARPAVIAIAVAPSAYFLFAPYTESLFLLLSVATFVAARERHFAAAGVAAALAVLCRVQGLLLIVPIAIEVWMALGQAVPLQGGAARVRQLRIQHAVALLLPVAALAGWFVYCRAALNLPLGPASAQRYWGHQFRLPWRVLADSVGVVASGRPVIERWNLGAVVIGLAAIPLIAWRLPRSYAAYGVLSVALCICDTSSISPLAGSMRYLTVVFPIFVLAGMVRLPHPAAWLASGAGLLGMLVLLDNYVHSIFTG